MSMNPSDFFQGKKKKPENVAVAQFKGKPRQIHPPPTANHFSSTSSLVRDD